MISHAPLSRVLSSRPRYWSNTCWTLVFNGSKFGSAVARGATSMVGVVTVRRSATDEGDEPREARAVVWGEAAPAEVEPFCGAASVLGVGAGAGGPVATEKPSTVSVVLSRR